jgi:hypothetical protein
MSMREFADALASKDLDRDAAWFADDVRLYTPVHEAQSLLRARPDSMGRPQNGASAKTCTARTETRTV